MRKFTGFDKSFASKAVLYGSLLVILIAIHATASIEYSGVIRRSVIGPDGNPKGTSSTYLFRAEVSPDRYRITRVATSGLSCFDEVAGSDGVDCYVLQKRWPSWKDKESHVGYQEVVRVTPGLYPSFASPEIQLVWTMLASQRYLTNEQPIVLSHISYAPYDELSIKVRYATNGNWPEVVEVFSPGSELVLGKKYPLPAPFENGYKLWEFSAEDVDKANGLSYPSKATFFQNSVFSDSTRTNAELRRILKIEIVTTNATEVSLPVGENYLPTISQTNLIALDYRFSPKLPRPNMGEVGAIQYRIRDRKWLDRSNSQVNASGVSLRIETNVADRSTTPSRRRFVILAVFFALTSVAAFFLIRRSKSF